MKRLLVLVLVPLAVLATVGAVAYVLLIGPIFALPVGVAVAESALATDDLILLAGLNVKQMTFLERWFLGRPAISVTNGRPLPEAAVRGIVDHLRAAQIDPRGDVDYAFFALYPTDGPTPRRAAVLVGRFDPAAIMAYVERDLHGTPRSVAGIRSYEVSVTDPATCQPGPVWMLTVESSWILIADPSSYATLVPRLMSPPREARAELAWWRALSRADVLSVGVWNLHGLDSALPRSPWQGSAAALAAEADVFERAYAGVGVKTVPPKVALRLVMDAAEAGRGAQRVKAWEQTVRASRARWAETMPSVASLYDSLRIRTRGLRTVMDVTINRKLATDSHRVVTEALGAMLSGFGVRVSEPGVTPTAEHIDSDPGTFTVSVTPETLPAYDPRAQFAEEVDQITGPFGLRVDQLRLGGEPGVGLELVVEGFANGVPNISGHDERARLVIDSVKGTSGQELLRPEACGRERNSQPAAFTRSDARRLGAVKTLRLISGADPRALQSVSGRVQLRLPTRTDVVTLRHPVPGATVDKHGATFTVTKVQRGNVGYQITGARDRVLDVRALNGKGQPLTSSSSFSSEFLFGDGLSGQENYSGVVDRLVITFATEEKAVEFPFVLTDFSFAGKPGGGPLDKTPPFRPYSHEALRRDSSRKPLPSRTMPEPPRATTLLEPFELSLDKVQPFYALRLDFTLRSPEAPNFQPAFTVGQLRLTRLGLRDGTVILAPAAGAATAATAAGPNWDRAVRFTSAPKDGVLSTSVSFYIDTDARPEDLKSVQGSLTMHFPRAFDTLALEDVTVGRQAKQRDLTATVVARSRTSLTIETNKDGERVYYIRLFGGDGQPLAFTGPNITAGPDGAWRFELSPLGRPARAEVILARDLERKVYPIALTLK